MTQRMLVRFHRPPTPIHANSDARHFTQNTALRRSSANAHALYRGEEARIGRSSYNHNLEVPRQMAGPSLLRMDPSPPSRSASAHVHGWQGCSYRALRVLDRGINRHRPCCTREANSGGVMLTTLGVAVSCRRGRVLASRISHLASRISHLASRISVFVRLCMTVTITVCILQVETWSVLLVHEVWKRRVEGVTVSALHPPSVKTLVPPLVVCHCTPPRPAPAARRPCLSRVDHLPPLLH
ncbi:hypothetical protein OH76DRAFT_1094714 [Lentinus brumalis]|uniref:Uncharacterized protein n=1 Tax=Lentinus brumalis TaxID=2498619 RepID=A0A371CW26_9APHY|nr:hypothetical protein OH76DRAFT_1094714 [Polyporus brumalis]